MDNIDHLSSFERDVEEFRNCIIGISDNTFLSSMGGWAPRDVIAHLIAWNGEMLKVCKGIRRGETPTYYTDALNDYSNLNARFIKEHSSREKETLLRELELSKNKLIEYLRSLDPTEWGADYGVVHYRDGAATVGRTIESLAGDYRHHTKEIIAWLKLGQIE